MLLANEEEGDGTSVVTVDYSKGRAHLVLNLMHRSAGLLVMP